KELNLEIQKTESEIQELRDRAPDKINKIAIETSTDLLHQLIGAEVNSSSISAIVDDLSRKKMDKYYGN
ncbi:F0F1 ATP synthase subunit B, partial [Candidatus Pelagibacter sp.]|nr:F0F1 ATP synthase subunit B [Candidatus Pelagibacter sp.]